jgi:hypothetical protein
MALPLDMGAYNNQMVGALGKRGWAGNAPLLFHSRP